jgi:hypothetical protein
LEESAMGSLGRDWDGISRFYRDQAPKSEMLDALSSLVEKLRVDGFPEAGPFGVTSMWDLCLGLSLDILDHPHLVIVVSDLPHRLEYRRAGSRVEWNLPGSR